MQAQENDAKIQKTTNASVVGLFTLVLIWQLNIVQTFRQKVAAK